MTSNNKCAAFSGLIIFILCLFIVYVAFKRPSNILNMSVFLTESALDNKLNDIVINNTIDFSQDYIRKYVNPTENLLEAHWLRMIKHYIPVPLESSYGSHKLALLAASILTAEHGGPSMEMGCGYHSTILLHQLLVNEQKRYLLSTDTDQEWLGKFETNMTSTNHKFRHIKETLEWDTVGVDRPRWSIVFVDHKPGERRVVDIIRLANVSDIVIVHDTETSSYNYEQGLSQYPYRYQFKYLSTYTDIASKTNRTLFRNMKRLLDLVIKLNLPKL